MQLVSISSRASATTSDEKMPGRLRMPALLMRSDTSPSSRASAAMVSGLVTSRWRGTTPRSSTEPGSRAAA
jgi:hypothetical protein